jgi:tetratricopeptide (TPR) repeat protein
LRPRLAFPYLAAFGLCCVCTCAPAASNWRLTRSEHFEIYSQVGDDASRSALLWFEQLRAFFLQQTGLKLDHSPAVRVIAFHSAKEYEPYRLHAAADAYYVGSGSRDYIVMAGLGMGEFPVAAHEYAHLILRVCGLRDPAWLNEGLAEFYSTVRIGTRVSNLGDPPPANIQTLLRSSWMPFSELMALTTESVAEDRGRAGLYYAQSWALSEMLLLSPEYGPRFPELIAALTLGMPGLKALAKVYAKSPTTISGDVHAWVDARHRFTPVALPGVAAGAVAVEVAEVLPLQARALLADLLLTSGQLNRAEEAYRELAKESPGSADLHAALGSIALRRGDSTSARREWKLAIEQGVRDALLCVRYAGLADSAGLPQEEIRAALERAVSLQPDCDDAHYKLALIEKNAGHYAIALEHLHAMRIVAPARAFNYWIAVADSLNELGKRGEAESAAQQATDHATTPAERERAAQLAYFAQTDFAVAFARDVNGRPQMVTTRVPHNMQDFNPFIEPSDDIRRVQGTLTAIDCNHLLTRFLVDTAAGPLALAIPDPTRVQMRNAPSEFTCGAQPAATVMVEYALSKTKDGHADGVVRGLAFQ